MRVLMLAPPAHVPSPLPRLVAQLAAALDALDCSVRVEPWGRRREDETAAEKVAGRAADIRRIHDVLGTERFDMLVVHTAHDWNTVSRDIALLVATRALCPIRVLHFHGSFVDRLVAPGHAAFKLASALLLGLSDASIVLSAEERRDWLAFDPSAQVYVAKNPIVVEGAGPPSPRTMLGVPDGVAVLLFVGRLLEAKGSIDLIDVLPAVLARAPCHLVLAGDGPAAAEMQRRAAAAGIASRLTFLGRIEGDLLRAAYAAAHVFVLPSWTEGLPLSLLEAMAAGLPVVTTRIRGMAEHLRDGEHALLVPPRDLAALESALVRVLGDADLRARMGRANREKAGEFAPEIVGRQYLAILKEIAGSTLP